MKFISRIICAILALFRAKKPAKGKEQKQKMALTTYTLQTMTLPTGTATVKLLSGIAGLVIPYFNSLDISADLVERCDLIPGTTEIENMEFSFIEDYSYYTQGFWFKVLNDSTEVPEVQILLNDGSGDTTWFWGRVEQESGGGTFEELDLTTGKIQRKGKFTCVHLMDKLKDTLVTTLMVRVDAVDSTGSDGHQYIKFQSIIAAMVTETFGYSFDITRCVVRGQPFRYKETATYYDFEDLWVRVGTSGAASGYRVSWELDYQNCFDLLRDLCQQFGYVARLVWNDAAAKWDLELLARGQAYAGLPISFDGIPTEKSTFNTHAQTINAVSVSGAGAAYPAVITNGTLLLAPTAFPTNVPIDISVTIFFNSSAIGGLAFSAMLWIDGGGTPLSITDFQYFDHSTRAYSADDGEKLHRAVVRYYWFLFSGNKRGYDRSYLSVRSHYANTLTHKNTHILRQGQIDDGTETSTVLDDGTAAFDVIVNNVVASLDSTVFAIGTTSPKFAISDAHTTGIFAADESLSTFDCSSYTHFRMWVRSSIALDVGDVTFGVDDTPTLASPLETIDLPAIVANEWTQVVLRIGNPSALTSLESLGFSLTVDKGAFNFWCDYIEAINTRMFYAVDVGKNIVNDSCSIKWQEV